MQFAIGQSVPRTEDPRLLKGNGRYSDDFNLAHQAYAHFVRSPHARANILRLDAEAALAVPGVLAVLTGKDWAGDGMGTINGPGIIGSVTVCRRNADGLYNPAWPPLHDQVVQFVGQHVAVVVAETPYIARDAAALVKVEYEPLPPVTDTATANAPDAPRLWPDCEYNEAFIYEAGDAEKTDALIAAAPIVVRQRLTINRVHASPLEPRAMVAHYDAREDHYTLYVGTQNAFAYRAGLTRGVFRIDDNQMRVITGDLGGSFGMKNGNAEAPIIAWASKRLGRPIKWTCARGESFVGGDYHGRDNVTDAELALDNDGRFLAMRVRTNANLGGFITTVGGAPAIGNIGTLAGVYTTQAMHVKVTAVFTNTVPVSPYRGAGRPEAAYVMERMIDIAARRMNIDAVELRRRNLIPGDAFPYKTPLTFTYDCGDFEQVLNQCITTADYAGFEARRTEAKARGKLRGIGVSLAIEIAARAGYDVAEIRFNASGTAKVMVGSTNHGQGHETIYSQLVSEHLGLEPDQIQVIEGDTDKITFGTGTGGSRSATMGSSAVLKAIDKCVAKGKKIAAGLLQDQEQNLTFARGRYRSRDNADREVSFVDVVKISFQPAALPEDVEVGMFETGSHITQKDNFPNGCHVVEVEIDPDTGRVALVNWCVVDDVGFQLNPLLVKGQIIGGAVQAAGQILMENIVFDEDGQVLTGSYMDYAMPRADDFCNMQVGSHPVPTQTNPLGVKGVGESGTVGGLPAVMNAIVDALKPLGIEHIEMPATPERVWRAIEQHRQTGKQNSEEASS